MPKGRCAECGGEDLVGPGLCEGEPFLCSDCDVELQAYSSAERLDLRRASDDRGRRVSAAAPALSALLFRPGPGEEEALRLFCDPDHVLVAGVGACIWPCAAPLARYLVDEVLGSALQEQEGRLPGDDGGGALGGDPGGRSGRLGVVELGAGCGAVGLWLWQRAAPRVRVCLTDLPRLCPLLAANAASAAGDAAGAAAVGAGAEAPLVRPLRWDVLEDLRAFRGEQWDLVVGSDITYSLDKVRPLMRTIGHLQPRRGAILSMGTCALRGPGGRALRKACRRQGWGWEKLREEPGSDGHAVRLVRLSPPLLSAAQRERQVAELQGLQMKCEKMISELAAQMAAERGAAAAEGPAAA